MNHEDTHNLKRLIMNKEKESVINNLPMKKSTESNGCTDEFYQIFKEKLTLIPLKLFTKIEENISKLNLQCHHYLTSKADRSNENQRLNIPDKYRCKNSQQNISKPKCIKRMVYHDQVGLIPGT